MIRTLMILAMLALTGCSAINLQGQFDNRVACTAAKNKGFVVSEWGPIGITGKLQADDTVVVCGTPPPAK